MKDDKRLANELRRQLHLPYHLDEEILKHTEGTFLRKRIEFGLALDDFRDALLDTLFKIKWVAKYWKRR